MTNWCVHLPRDVGVIVVAAGRGARFGGDIPKQYLRLRGQPMLLHTLRPFTSHPDVAHVVVVLPAADVEALPPWLAPLVGDLVSVTPGGTTRRESVAAGLEQLAPECTVVLVHDGARPFPPREIIDSGIATARQGHGAVPAVPVADTLKRADDFGRVLTTVARDGLWAAQTPQAFPRTLLERAHQYAAIDGLVATDDAMLVELAGGRVDLLPSTVRNLKVTTADDLALAEWYAAQT